MVILDKVINIFNTKSIFIKLLSFFILLLVLSVLLVGYTSYLSSSRLLIDEVKSNNLLELKQVRDNIDQKIVLLDSTSLQIGIDKRVKKAFYMEDRINPTNILLSTEIITYLSGIKSSNDFIDSIILYFNKSDLIVANDGKYDLDTFLNNIYVDNKLTRERWMKIANEYTLFKVSDEYEVSEHTVKNRTITFLRSLPIEIRDPYCTVLINVDRKELGKIIGNTENRNQVSVFVIDSRANIIEGNNISESQRDLNYRVLKSIIEENGHIGITRDKYTDVDINGDLYSVALTDSFVNGWKYVSVIPIHYITERTEIIKKITLLTIAVSILLGLLLSFALTRSVYVPIKNIVRYIAMIKGLKLSTKSSKDRNEMNIINSFIDVVFRENKNLSEVINKSIPMLQEKFLDDLLEGQVQDREITEIISNLNMNMPFDAFQVVVFEIDDYSEPVQQLLQRSDKKVPYIIDEIAAIEPFFISTRVYSIEKRNGKYISLINISSNNENPEIVYELINHVTGYFAKEFGVFLTIGVGRVYKHYKEISASYIECLYALKCKIIEGNRRIIHIDEVSNLSENPFIYPMESEKQIVNCVKSGDYHGVSGILQEILGRNTERKDISPEMLDNLFAALAGTAVRAVYEANATIGDIFGQEYNIYSMLNETDSVQYKEQYILSIFEKITGHIDTRRKSRNDILYNKLTSYVEENYFRDISLDIVGEAFGLSPSYLSWLFKEISGKNFIDYLNSYRIQEAKKYLKESNFSVNEIGEKVGYANSNTFIRVFKKYEGVTPGCFKNNC